MGNAEKSDSIFSISTGVEVEEGIEIRFIEQEHRTLPVWSNFVQYVVKKTDYPKRRVAATRALISWFFSPGGIIALTLPLGAVLASWFAYEANQLFTAQNELLVKQNDRLAEQNIEMRASRESQLYVAQLVPLIDNLTREGRSTITEHNLARIETFAQTLGPYETRQFGNSTFEFSPERGRLLLALLSIGYPLSEQQVRILNFARAGFGDVSMNGVSLGPLSLQGADLRTVDLKRATLDQTNLVGAFLPDPSRMDGISMTDVDLTGAYVSSEDWLDDLARATFTIKDSAYGVAIESAEPVNFDFGRWITKADDATRGFRLWPNESLSAFNAVIEEMEFQSNSGDYFDPEDTAHMTDHFGSWYDEAVRSLNRLNTYKTPTYQNVPVSPERGEFLKKMSEWGLELTPIIEKGASFRGAIVGRDVQLIGDLKGADFRDADLNLVSFEGKDLSGVDFAGANLPSAHAFGGSILMGINLEGAIVDDPNWLRILVEMDKPVLKLDTEQWATELADSFEIIDPDQRRVVEVNETFVIRKK